MKIGIISLFPEMFRALHHGITGRALEKGLLDLYFYHPRDFTQDKHRNVDDKPYGGGPGMVMMYQPLAAAIQAAKKDLGVNTPVIFMTPQGQSLKHESVVKTSQHEAIILLAGRYEGIDERIRQQFVDVEWSLGDYVISGGELAAMVVIDAIIRQLPGALGNEQSLIEDSFVNGFLDHPHYTRPEVIDDLPVPSVLMSGDHQAIKRWRLKQSIGRTWQRRPDVFNSRQLSNEQQRLLDEFIAEHGATK
ncbi:MAG: tRNA (guanosine(37)-N1)-methyltransferase TrmD [Legionellales bacterium]|nr:tRNA (guanosine(37)-N1)-methyltransferase TrmD [Legionellales bacterium]